MSSIFDFETKPQMASAVSETPQEEQNLKIHMPDAPEGVYVEIGKDQIKRKYEDEVGARLLIVVDEVAELLQPSGVKSEAGKEEDAIKQEISMIIQSITQLGRSAGIHMVLATQRNDAKIIPGVVQNNSLSLDTKLTVRRGR